MMRSPQSESGPPNRSVGSAVLGLAMALLGSLLLVGLAFISNDPSPASEALMFHLGLATMALISMVAQGLVVVGVVLLWRRAARHRG